MDRRILIDLLDDFAFGSHDIEQTADRITELYKQTKALKLQQTGVVRSCSHENYTNYCNTDGSFSHKLCDDCFEMFD